MSKPILLIGVDPGMSRDGTRHLSKELREQFPHFFVAVVGGMRYATVLPNNDESEPDPGPIALTQEWRGDCCGHPRETAKKEAE
jgi:hypothetical protein